MPRAKVAIIGGGPAGLMAAESLAKTADVTVFEAMPTVARKFLLAGKSGLNITHSEDYASFITRFGRATPRLLPALELFPPKAIQDWAEGLGSETFIGSSGRVFPKAMKASPLLRAWLQRLSDLGVQVLTRHRWLDFAEDALLFDTPEGAQQRRFDAVLFALGGASWPRLGSDAAWVKPFAEKGIKVEPFKPANCGFDVAWSSVMRERFAGAAVKSVTASSTAGSSSGEFVITETSIEGGLVYTHAAGLRDALDKGEAAFFEIDLKPDWEEERLATALARQQGKSSLANRLRKAAGIDGVKAALLREFANTQDMASSKGLARLIKKLAIPLQAPRPIAEAISSAGGVVWDEIDSRFMICRMPGVFVAGEMLDWEAPTGGYLLTACFASGRAAAAGILDWLSQKT
ncbi:TIGR03862 family flavoprotein [Oryzifoliimicrobium ureilyticus]|uniref:TIGR03862 family flavoprotein n=1 Tax=Oryzifoliimicrobium ureilyticus TaxID=3113724 RepID=UPI0030766215